MRRFLRSALCRMLGHVEPWRTPYMAGYSYSLCARCDQTIVRRDPESPSPTLAPSWSPSMTYEEMDSWRSEAVRQWAERRAGSAVTAPPVPEATPVAYTPPPGHYFESGIGVGGSWSCNVDHGGSPCSWLTPASATAPVSSISTDQPSYVSRRSIAAPSK